MRKTILGLLMLATVAACNKKDDGSPETTGVLQLLALDGCTYIIVLENGTRLEPVGNTSGVDLQPNKLFVFRYRIKPTPSICMAGETVEIISLRYL